MSFDHRLHQKLIVDFESYLSELRKERRDRAGLTQLGEETYPEWAAFEIESLFSRINEERKNLGLDPCALQEVQLADSQASGHSDYSHKFALYCAEIAQGTFRN
jgi:hypothetical protein